ncbi:MAG: NAD(P)H-hydrate dehydratase [Bacteroidetes bacterium]|nr:NAD(P)H-hydrate dehydratase [Bacteroidota bacterium]
MIKVFSSQQIKQADEATLRHKNISELQLMEHAAECCTSWILENYAPGFSFAIFCGKGNNGGDGLAIARQLFSRGKNIDVYLVEETGKETNCFTENLKAWKSINGSSTISISNNKQVPEFKDSTIIIDALFGIGLNRPIESPVAEIIQEINSSPCKIISIDVPSGLFCDKATVELKNVIAARHTLTFSYAKQAFFYPEYAHLTGNIEILDIHLDKKFEKDTAAVAQLPTDAIINSMLGSRPSFGHKGTFGHALLLVGSTGKSGAALLATQSCLRSGVGLVTVRTPKDCVLPIQVAAPEAMCNADEHSHFLTDIVKPEGYSAIGLGPGIGMDHQTGNVVKRLIQDYKSAMVLDADALNHLSDNPTWLNFLPAECILTPHLGEFNRLAGKIADPFERTKKQIEIAKKYNCYILLKGKYSALACPDGQLFFNPTGNHGMAKGGSGDVLTGLITGLLAQGLSPLKAALCGAYLHGLAGDYCAQKTHPNSMTSGDIISFFADAFRAVKG